MYPLVSRVILTGLLIPENISSTILSLRWSGAVGKKVRKKSRLSDSVRGAGDVIITIDSDNHRLFHQSRALKRQVYKGKIWYKSGFIFSKFHRPDKHMENLIIHEKSPVRRTLLTLVCRPKKSIIISRHRIIHGLVSVNHLYGKGFKFRR